ncbi:MAG: hypothetical protein AAFR33_12110 [Pseudomonadota bacterium]
MTDQIPFESAEFEDLSHLWQSQAPVVDTEQLVARLKRHNRRLRRLNQFSFATCIFMVAITLVLELGGRLPTGGLLSLGGSALLIFSWWKYRRDKARLMAAYSEEPDKLLPFLIQRTKAARNLGRYYYTTPGPSILFGYFWARFTPDRAEADVNYALLYPFVAIGLAAMITLTVYGLKLARQKTRELAELQQLARDTQRD